MRHVVEARVTLVVGATEAGKSTLIAEVARRLTEGGSRVGIVDADLGQSEIGPPTTIGLGRAHPRLRRLADAEPIALHFVGTTSAARNVVSAVVGVRRMLDRARALDLEHVIVDTSGLIAGDLGRTLKQAKIDVTDPDLVICLEAHGECEPIVHPYARRDRPRIVRLPPLAAPRRRSADDRRRHRAAALARHLAAARPQTLDLARVALRQPALLIGEPLGAVQLLDASDAAGTPVLWGERSDAAIALVAERRLTPAETGRIAGALGGGTVVSHGLDELVGVLAGLDDLHGEMRGIGVVRAVDFRAREMVVDTAVPADVIAVVTVGKERFEET